MMEETVFKKMLLVDDIPTNLYVLREAIQQYFPYTTMIEAQSGIEALTIVNQEQIDIILMDVQMPEMDGFETAQLIRGRAKTSQIPIIFITAFDADSSKMSMGLAAGGIDYLTKPLDDKQLIRLLLLYQRFVGRERKINNDLELANLTFKIEIQERYRVEQTFRQLNEKLDSLVKERTQELLTEIEERKNIEMKLKQSQAELTIVNLSLKEALGEVKRVNDAKSEFLASMSHEIRSPMNSIMGIAEILKTDERNPEKIEKLDLIHYCGNHLLGLISDILDLSKIEAGKIVLNNKEFSLTKLLYNIYNVMKVKADEKHLEFELIAGCGRDFWVVADEQIISQILINLISNAIKFTDIGSVRFIASCESGMFSVNIVDTGIGIPSDKLKSIFEAFEQGHKNAQTRKDSTGLGLAITRKLVDLLEGSIDVTSVEGQGSDFALKLPVVVSDLSEKSKIMATNNFETVKKSLNDFETVLKQTHVLVVDDDEINQILLKAAITNMKLDCDQAFNGKSALAMMQEKDYQIVLLDIEMPEMGGMEVLSEIRSNPRGRDIHVIASTAHATIGDDEKYQSAGFNDYMSKPFDKETLSAKFINYLNKF